jgi:hypothetical protein
MKLLLESVYKEEKCQRMHVKNVCILKYSITPTQFFYLIYMST